jgi:hypothetical protein
MFDRLILIGSVEQRELLRAALADAVLYRDPPLQCDACESLDGLCDGCAAGMTRARFYLHLGREFGLELSV